ncbi:MAG: NosD domain-containing protein [Thermoplasmata archaeon]|nr:NosD domain-containing protein [Thermoplasmata archaeon]
MAFLVSLIVIASSIGLPFGSVTGVSDTPEPTDPPAAAEGLIVKTGNWTVSSQESYMNAIIYLNGNLSVTGFGTLVFVNTTLVLNLSYSGQYRIDIGGKFTMDDSDGNPATQSDASRIISNRSTYKYGMAAQSASRLYFNNSIVMHCGYSGLNLGLTVLTPTARFTGMAFMNCLYGIYLRNSGARLVNCTFAACNYGVHAYFCSPTLMNLTVSDCTARGMSLYYSNSAITGCRFVNNKVGIYLQNSEPDVKNCNISGSSTSGVTALYSSPLLTDCVLGNSMDMDVTLNSYPRLLNTALNESRVSIGLGLFISVGERMNVLAEDQNGTAVQGMQVSVLDAENNPSSMGYTDEFGMAQGLAFRRKMLTREGPIGMDIHRIIAFGLDGENVTYGENRTALSANMTAVVRVSGNPSNVYIWPNGHMISNYSQYNGAKIICLGSVSITPGAGMELENSELLAFGNTECIISAVSGTLGLFNTSVRSIGTFRLLEPALTGITADVESELVFEDINLEWITELELAGCLADIRNLTIRHAGVCGIRITGCAPTVDRLSIDWTPVGLQMTGDYSAITNSAVRRATEHAVYASQSHAILTNMSFSDSARGLYSYSGDMAVSELSSIGCDYGIFGYYSTIHADSSNIQGSAVGGLYFIDSAAWLDGCNISDSDQGIYAQTSKIWGESCMLPGNRVGLKVVDCDPVMLNSSFSNACDVETGRHSSAALVNCTLDLGRTSIQPSGYIDIGNWTDVLVLGETLFPVSGCNVSVRDSSDRVSSSGITDENGLARNLAYREKRLRWNLTEEYYFHTVIAMSSGSEFGSNFTGLVPDGTAEVLLSADNPDITEWPSYMTVDKNLELVNKTVIAHIDVYVNSGATLRLDNSTIWFMGPLTYRGSMNVDDGNLIMTDSSIMPLSATAPLRPYNLWLTFDYLSTGVILNSTIRDIFQITSYTDGLSIIGSDITDIAEAGLDAEGCSPIIEDSVFMGCGEGIWSNGGSPTVNGTAFIECGGTGFYSDGGASQLRDNLAMFNTIGFSVNNESNVVLANCAALSNENGFSLNSASPDISDCSAFNNTNSGFYLLDAHSSLEGINSSGNGMGVNCMRSWPVIANSTVGGNSYGIYAYQSGPFISNCSIEGNQVGLNIVGDANGITEDAFSSGFAEEDATFVEGGVRDHISVSLPARAIVRYATLNITGIEMGNDAVIADAFSQFAPAIYGNWVVWEDYRDGNSEVYAYNLSVDSDGNRVPNYLETPQIENDPALVRITDEPEWQGEPDIFEETIVWTDYRNGNADIYAYTFSNSTEWAVCIHPSAQSKPSIDGDRIVWQDYRVGNYDIFMWDISENREFKLSETNWHDMSPNIQGEHIVWYSYYGSPPSSDYSDIFMFDLSTWQVQNLNKDAAIQYNPDVYGDTVVWHGNTDGNWEIYRCNVDTLEIERVTFDPEGEQNFMPRIYGDRVVYYFHNRFTNLWSVRMFNLTLGEQTVLDYQTNGDSSPVIHGEKIAWLNKTANLNDIFVLDLTLTGTPEDVSADMNSDGTAEFSCTGEFNSTETLNGTMLAEALNLNLNRVSPDVNRIPIRISANGTGKVVLGPLSIRYDIPTYIVRTNISDSGTQGALCSGSSPIFVNCSFAGNPLDFVMNTEARPTALNSSFSDAKLVFQDRLSNLTVQNYLHVLVENLTSDPLDARVIIRDNGQAETDAFTGPDGKLEWNPVTDAVYNISGRNENSTDVSVSMNENIFPSNPRDVDMAVSHWEVFTTDSIGPVASDLFPPPWWTSAELSPEISVIVTDNLAVNLSTVRLYVNSFMVFYNAVPVPGGYNITYQHPIDFPNGSAVECRIYAKDYDGNVLDLTWEFRTDTRAVMFTIELEEGWNLISIPLEMSYTSVEEVLSSISGKWDAVKWYDPLDTADPWKSYRAGGTANDLLDLGRTMGIWAHVNAACTLSVSGLEPATTGINLHAGWNLVGYPTLNETVTVSFAFWGTGADRVEVFDPVSPYIREAEPTYTMTPGEGYWVRVTGDTVWTVNW